MGVIRTTVSLAMLWGEVCLCLLAIAPWATGQDKEDRQALQRWQRFIEEGEFRKAAEVVKGLIAKYPYSGNIRTALVLTYLKASWLDEALRAAHEAEQVLPENPEVLNALVACHLVAGNFAAACDKGLAALRFAQAQGLSPQDTLLLRFHLGLAYLLNGETTQALMLLEGVAENDPTESHLRPLAAAYRIAEREGDARRILEKVQRSSAKMLQAWDAFKQQSQREETTHFSIWFPHHLSASERRKIRLHLKQTYQRLSTAFGGNPEGKVQVVICPDLATFSRLSPSPTAEAGGWYRNGTMLLGPPEDVRRRGLSLQTIVSHELVHHFAETLSSQEAPAWLVEGLAEQESIAARQEGMSDFAKALQGGSLYPLRAFEVMTFNTGDRWIIQVYFVAKFLIQVYGYPAIGRFLHRVGEKKNVEAALQSAFGLTYEELEKRWKEFARAQLKELLPVPKAKQ